MSFDRADKSVEQIHPSYQQRHETEAVVESLKAVDITMHNLKDRVEIIGNSVNSNLRNLKESSDKVGRHVESLTDKLKQLSAAFNSLNDNLKDFDQQATSLGKKANFLTWGLLVFAGIQALATVAQVWLSWGGK